MNRRGFLTALTLGAASSTPLLLPSATAQAATRTVNGHVLKGKIYAMWKLNSAVVGKPTTNEYRVSGGIKQRFEHAHMYYSTALGASIIKGKIRTTYDAAKAKVPLGLPVGKEVYSRAFKAYRQPTATGCVFWNRGDGGQAVPNSRTARLAEVVNFRDAAGPGAGLVLTAGRMRRGTIFRSNRPYAATGGDKLILTSAGIASFIDLRTSETARKSPDPVIPGISYRLFNVFGTALTPSHAWSDAVGARAGMQANYRLFVTSPVCRSVIAEVLTDVARSSAPLLIHCTDGKDRTGWVVAVLQHILGADEESIRKEYLKSNQYMVSVINARYAKDLSSRGRKYAEAKKQFSLVEDSYLDAAWEQAHDTYGSLDRYVRLGLNLSETTLGLLRSRLVVD